MGQASGIEWTDFTSNPLKFRNVATKQIVWACVKVSGGCAHCYAENLALRYRRGTLFNARNMEALDVFLDEKELRWLLTNQAISGKRVFVGDMTDLFGEWVPFGLLDTLFAVFALRPDVQFQVLTKRSERMRRFVVQRCCLADSLIDAMRVFQPDVAAVRWPLPNVWLGVSVEDQAAADERIPHLLRTPAAVRFLSCEPLLGAVDLSEFLFAMLESGARPRLNQLDWVIVGGESGPGARAMHPEWARSLRDQCVAAGVPFFFKQWGEWAPDCLCGGKRACKGVYMDGLPTRCMFRCGKAQAGRLLDGLEWNEFPAVWESVG